MTKVSVKYMEQHGTNQLFDFHFPEGPQAVESPEAFSSQTHCCMLRPFILKDFCHDFTVGIVRHSSRHSGAKCCFVHATLHGRLDRLPKGELEREAFDDFFCVPC